MKRVYLDYAAAVPVERNVQNVFLRALRAYGNPSSPHEEGRIARDILERARTHIARELGVRPASVIFTSGATEGNALCLLGYARALVRAGRPLKDLHILHLSSSHASVVENIAILKSEGVETQEIPLTNGDIDYPAFRALLKKNTVLVSIDAVCGETGARFDTRKIKGLLQEHKSGALLHVDASQLPLFESVERTRLGADFMTLDAAKVGGVRSIGVLVTPPHISLVPLYGGGGQERGLRPGTESPAHAEAFAAALGAAGKRRASFIKKAARLRARLLAKLTKALPSIVVHAGKQNAPHIVNISLLGCDTDYLVMLLDHAGFAISTKSACETDASGSRAVLALTGDKARANATLRVSFGHSTKKHEIDSFGKALIEAVRFLTEHPV